MRTNVKYRVYSAEKNGRTICRRVLKAIHDLSDSSFLAKSLLARDIKAKYRQTMLGFVGALWPALVSTLVFAFLNSTQVLNVDTGDMPYVVFAFTGSIFWTFFVEAVNVPMTEFLANSAMLTRLDFPREAIVIKGVVNSLINLAIKLFFWLLLLVFFGVSFHWEMLGLVLTIANLTLFATGVGLVLMPIMVIYRDINQIFTSALNFLMYLTPVMYPVADLKYFGDFAHLNPLTNIFNFMRSTAFSSSFEHLEYNLIFLFSSICLVLFGWMIYRVSIPFLVERMQA